MEGEEDQDSELENERQQEKDFDVTSFVSSSDPKFLYYIGKIA